MFANIKYVFAALSNKQINVNKITVLTSRNKKSKKKSHAVARPPTEAEL